MNSGIVRMMMGGSVDEKGNGDVMKGVRIKWTFYVERRNVTTP